MAGLPYADYGAICLDLIHVSSLDPDVLHNRLLYDYRLLLYHDGLLHYNRSRGYDRCRCYNGSAVVARIPD